ncbi:MAG: hypothetical protein DDT37_01500 [Firmicutes bacterium]|nr:hypothetical protein [candidate division NPL-UPA2 bacterium]
MRTKDNYVTRLNGVNSSACRCKIGIRGWNNGGDDTNRFGVLYYAFFRYLLDDANAFLTQRIAQYAANLKAFVSTTYGVP